MTTEVSDWRITIRMMVRDTCGPLERDGLLIDTGDLIKALMDHLGTDMVSIGPIVIKKLGTRMFPEKGDEDDEGPNLDDYDEEEGRV